MKRFRAHILTLDSLHFSFLILNLNLVMMTSWPWSHNFSCLVCLSGETIVLYHHAELVVSFFLFRWMFPSFSSFSIHGLYEFRCTDNTFKAMMWCCSVEGYNPSSVLHKHCLRYRKCLGVMVPISILENKMIMFYYAMKGSLSTRICF